MPFQAKKRSLRALALLLFVTLNAFAADLPPLLRFAQQHAGLPPAQITDRAAFERETVVRVKLGDRVATRFEYDEPTGTALIRLKSTDNHLGLLFLAEDCQTAEKTVVRTTVGAQSPSATRTCERVVFSEQDDTVIGQPLPAICPDACPPNSVLLAKATPAEFRRLQDMAHVIVAVTFTPMIADGVPVRRTERTRPPRPGDAVETLTRTYYLSAKVRKLEFFLPWATTPFATQPVSN